MIRPRPWKPRTIWIEIHFNWVFAEAYQLEDLFMEPWVEATYGGGGGGEIWVFFLFNSFGLELWNLIMFGC